MHYARLCQQWEQPLLSLLSLFILYALCFNTRAHHVPLLLLAAVFMVGLASHARQDDSDIITFDTEAIPSEWLREGALHKMRRWRGMLGKASFVLGQVASRVERVSAAFNWTDGHLTLLVYGFLAAATSALTLLLYFVPAGVVVMLIGSAAMLDGLAHRTAALGAGPLHAAEDDRHAAADRAARRPHRPAQAHHR